MTKKTEVKKPKVDTSKESFRLQQKIIHERLRRIMAFIDMALYQKGVLK